MSVDKDADLAKIIAESIKIIDKNPDDDEIQRGGAKVIDWAINEMKDRDNNG